MPTEPRRREIRPVLVEMMREIAREYDLMLADSVTINKSKFARWLGKSPRVLDAPLEGGQPEGETLALLARKGGINPVRAFIAQEWLTEDEVLDYVAARNVQEEVARRRGRLFSEEYAAAGLDSAEALTMSERQVVAHIARMLVDLRERQNLPRSGQSAPAGRPPDPSHP